MKRIIFTISIMLMASIVYQSCNTSNEEVIDKKQAIDKIRILDSNAGILASYTSEEEGVTVKLLEASEGNIGVTVVFDSTATEVVMNKYSAMVDEVQDEKISLDQFYKKMAGDKTDSHTENILKGAEERLQKFRELPKHFIEPSQEEISLYNTKIEKRVEENSSKDFSSQGKTHAPCLISRSETLTSQEFRDKYCHPLKADPVSYLPPEGAPVSYCYYDEGPSTEAFVRSSSYYRLTLYNPYVSNTKLFGFILLEDQLFFYFTVEGLQTGFAHWFGTNSMYAYVIQNNLGCKKVAYVTRRGVN